MNGRFVLAVAGAAALFAPVFASAFPENIRHGYINCTSCHVSPNGGGALTAYGRELSREAMSTWGEEGEQRWLYAVSQPESLALGGDVRSAWAYRDDPRVRQGKWYFMQADVEGYVNLLSGSKQQLWIGGSGGFEKKNQDVDRYDPISRRHWINWRPSDELSFRAGKFQAQTGLNIADHIAFIRQDLGRTPGSETYNVEATWIGEHWTGFATAVFGRPDDPSIGAEKGFALSGGYALGERARIGVSAYRGENDALARHQAGPFAMLGLTERLFLLSELDWQWTRAKATETENRGFVSYNRLGYEVYKGLIPYLVHEFKSLADRNWAGRTDAWGIGAQWLPRPHWEINGAFSKRRTPSMAEGYVDYAYLMLHFYF